MSFYVTTVRGTKYIIRNLALRGMLISMLSSMASSDLRRYTFGLKGTYAYKRHRVWWEDSEYALPTRKFFLNYLGRLLMKTTRLSASTTSSF